MGVSRGCLYYPLPLVLAVTTTPSGPPLEEKSAISVLAFLRLAMTTHFFASSSVRVWGRGVG